MKVMIRLAKGKNYICNVKAESQLEAAAKAALKAGLYGCMPVFRFN